MNVEGGVPLRVIEGVRRVLEETPSGATARDLAWGLDIAIDTMYRYVNSLHREGLLELVSLTSDLKGKGRRTRLWRWAG